MTKIKPSSIPPPTLGKPLSHGFLSASFRTKIYVHIYLFLIVLLLGHTWGCSGSIPGPVLRVLSQWYLGYHVVLGFEPVFLVCKASALTLQAISMALCGTSLSIYFFYHIYVCIWQCIYSASHYIFWFLGCNLVPHIFQLYSLPLSHIPDHITYSCFKKSNRTISAFYWNISTIYNDHD